MAPREHVACTLHLAACAAPVPGAQARSRRREGSTKYHPFPPHLSPPLLLRRPDVTHTAHERSQLQVMVPFMPRTPVRVRANLAASWRGNGRIACAGMASRGHSRREIPTRGGNARCTRACCIHRTAHTLHAAGNTHCRTSCRSGTRARRGVCGQPPVEEPAPCPLPTRVSSGAWLRACAASAASCDARASPHTNNCRGLAPCTRTQRGRACWPAHRAKGTPLPRTAGSPWHQTLQNSQKCFGLDFQGVVCHADPPR
jgi:hypothetical protein